MRHLLVTAAFLAVVLVPAFLATSYGVKDTPDTAMPPGSLEPAV